MNMPTPCPECGEIVELDVMRNIGHELYCDECYEALESDSE